MERYSLYIDHQQVSQLIRRLESILQTCYEELDEQYEKFQLRTSIYQEFIFQITSLFNSKYALKQEANQVKQEELKKYFELTSKLENINSPVKYEHLIENQFFSKKGRPTKNHKADNSLIKWIKQKISTEGKLKFTKKELDEIYFPLFTQNKKKAFSVNSYLRVLKRYSLLEVSIIARGGKQKSVADFIERKIVSQLQKKEQDEDLPIKSEYKSESEIGSASQGFSDHDLSDDYQTKKQKIEDFNQFQKRSIIISQKHYTKKENKENKQKIKKMASSNFFQQNSEMISISHDWDRLNISDEFFELKKSNTNQQIYHSSKSFQSQCSQNKSL